MNCKYTPPKKKAFINVLIIHSPDEKSSFEKNRVKEFMLSMQARLSNKRSVPGTRLKKI